MKKLAITFLLSLILLLGACGKINNPSDVISSLEKEDIKGTEVSMNSYFKLGIKNSFESSYKLENEDSLLVYVLDTKEQIKSAKKQFKEQLTMSKSQQTPTYYTSENVLIVHLAVVPNEKFSKTLKTALNEFLTLE